MISGILTIPYHLRERIHDLELIVTNPAHRSLHFSVSFAQLSTDANLLLRRQRVKAHHIYREQQEKQHEEYHQRYGMWIEKCGTSSAVFDAYEGRRSKCGRDQEHLSFEDYDCDEAQARLVDTADLANAFSGQLDLNNMKTCGIRVSFTIDGQVREGYKESDVCALLHGVQRLAESMAVKNVTDKSKIRRCIFEWLAQDAVDPYIGGKRMALSILSARLSQRLGWYFEGVANYRDYEFEDG